MGNISLNLFCMKSNHWNKYSKWMMDQKVLSLSTFYLFIHSPYFTFVFSHVSEVIFVLYFLKTYVGEFLNVMAVWVNLHELSKR